MILLDVVCMPATYGLIKTICPDNDKYPWTYPYYFEVPNLAPAEF